MEGGDQEGAVGGEQALTSFNISEAELIGLQQAGGLGSLAGQDSAEHLSQGDLEALASIQDELDRMSSGQTGNIISEEMVMGSSSGSGLSTSLQGDQVLVQAPAFDQNGLELSSLGAAEPQLVSPSPTLRHTVRVVKRPASGSQAGGVKVRGVDASSLGSGGQFRIVNTSQAFSLGGQQVRLVNAGANLKTIAPSDSSSSMGNISIVNQDGSFTTLPIGTQIGGGSSIRIVSGGGTTGVARPGVRAQPIQPQLGGLAQPVRILPGQVAGNFKILNRDGSLSEISSSFIRPKSDLNPSGASSPKKKNVTYSNIAIKSPQKVITLKPPEGGPGQVIRTADGRLISLQGAAKKVVLPVASSSTASNVLPLQQTFSPTKIAIEDSQGNNVQTVSQTRGVGQVLRLDQPAEKVQYVRVVNSAGKSQTLPIRALGAEVGIQGVTVRPAGQVEIRSPAAASSTGASNLSNLPDPALARREESLPPAREKTRTTTTSMEPHGVRPRFSRMITTCRV